MKHAGDGIMASFDKPANAVHAAADVQRRFAAFNADASETLSVQIGVHAGEPVEHGNDLFGATIHLAARLRSRRETIEIGVSISCASSARDDPTSFVALGERRLKRFLGKSRCSDLTAAGQLGRKPRRSYCLLRQNEPRRFAIYLKCNSALAIECRL